MRAVAALVVLTSIVGGASAAEVGVDFDADAAGTHVTDQHRNLGGTDAGVVFRQSPSGPYGPPVAVIDAGSGAHSGTHVAQIYESRGEFPWAFVWGLFPAANKTVVRAFVGSPAGSVTRDVSLTGYDVNGTAIPGAKQVASVPGDGTYDTMLQIADGQGRITYFLIGLEGSGLIPVLGVDDVTFDVPALPPTPNFGLVLDLNETLLGPVSVARGGTSQFGARVIVNRFAASQGPLTVTTSGLPAGVTPVIAADDAANPAAYSVKLTAAGSAPVVVNQTFTFIASPGTSASGAVPHSVEIPFTVLDNYDLAVTGVEVTQGIQVPGDLPPGSPPGSAISPLVAYDGLSLVTNKRTVVRVFAAVAAPLGTTVSGARLRLHGHRMGGALLPGSPLKATLGPLGNGNPTGVSQATRVTGPAFAFVLPPEWTAPGRIDLEAEIIPPTGIGPGAMECPPPACAGNNRYLVAGIPFYDTGFLNVAALRLTFAGQAFPGFPPEILSGFEQLVPLADGELRRADDWRAEYDVTNLVSATQNRQLQPFLCPFPSGTCPFPVPGAASCAWCDAPPNLDKWLLSYALDFTSGEEGCDDEYADDRHAYCFDAVVAMIDDRGVGNPVCVQSGSCIFGLSKGGRTISGKGSRAVTNIRRPLTSVSHEIGHGFSLKHASDGCGGAANGQKATGWPDGFGTIRGLGYDLRDASVKVTGNAPPRVGAPPSGAPAGAWYDFMSYCADVNAEVALSKWFPWATTDSWISTVNWDYMHTILRGLDIHHSSVLAPAAAIGGQASSSAATLRVRGFLEGSQVVLAQIGPGRGDVSPPGAGPYRLVVRDAAGGSLGETPMIVESSEGHGEEATFLSADVPLAGAEPGTLPDALAAVEVVTDAGPVARIARSPHPPSVAIRGPRRHARVGRERRTVVRWRASDADGDALTTTVEYSVDDGSTWTVLWKGPDRARVTVPSGLLARSRTARLRVRVSDGFDEATSVSPRFVAVGRPPTIRILSPAAGTTVPADARLPLVAAAQDDRGRAIPDDAIRWYVGGRRVGRGRAVSVAGLRPGRTVVLAVARSGGRTGRALAGIRVQRVRTP